MAVKEVAVAVAVEEGEGWAVVRVVGEVWVDNASGTTRTMCDQRPWPAHRPTPGSKLLVVLRTAQALHSTVQVGGMGKGSGVKGRAKWGPVGATWEATAGASARSEVTAMKCANPQAGPPP